MTTDTPSTSGEGVDVLAYMRGIHTMLADAIAPGNVIRVTPLQRAQAAAAMDLVQTRIAELIEAADDYLNDRCSKNKLRVKLSACRANPGAHP